MIEYSQMFSHAKKITKRLAVAFTVFFLLGAFMAFAARFVFVKIDRMHYHANFALYINGDRDEFKAFTFYEEETACASDHEVHPQTRVHMHDQENSVVHVHSKGSTWGHFFANLGYTLGDNVLATTNGEFVNGQDGKLSFLLNGKSVDSIDNEVIGNEDTLLIDFSNDSGSVLKSRYGSIENKATKHNEEDDPASCSGSEAEPFGDRLKRTLGIN